MYVHACTCVCVYVCVRVCVCVRACVREGRYIKACTCVVGGMKLTRATTEWVVKGEHFLNFIM